MSNLDLLIDKLSQQLEPVRVHRGSTSRLILAATAAASISGIAVVYGLRGDVMTMRAPPLLMVAIGLMAILGCASGVQAVRMARPQVGAPTTGTPWLVAALGLLPLLALAALLTDPAAAVGLNSNSGIRCLVVGLASGLASLGFLTFWLRRGAPVAADRAAWLAGLSAGAIGAAAVTLECGRNEIAHLGLWHVAVVAVMAIAARVALPRLLRW